MTTTIQPVRVALVEDHAATRAAIAQILGDFATRIDLVLTVADGESLLRVLSKRQLDVALVDLKLPGMDGCEVIAALREQAPRVRALALTTFDDEETLFDAMRAGAYGYLLKDEAPERLAHAIADAAGGGHPISSRVAGFLIAHARQRPPPIVLSEREEELALALAKGLTYAECAAHMNIGVGTVQDYVKRVYRKLDVRSKSEIRRWVTRYLQR